MGINIEHHHRIFVLRRMTVKRKRPEERAEFHVDHRRRVWPQDGGITFELLLREVIGPRFAALQQLQLMGFQVDMDRVPPSPTAVHQSPFLRYTHRHGYERLLRVKFRLID